MRNTPCFGNLDVVSHAIQKSTKIIEFKLKSDKFMKLCDQLLTINSLFFEIMDDISLEDSF